MRFITITGRNHLSLIALLITVPFIIHININRKIHNKVPAATFQNSIPVIKSKNSQQLIQNGRLVTSNNNYNRRIAIENEIPTKKKIHNFFNCNKEFHNPNPLCTYTNIKDFFESMHGLGYKYRQLAFRYARETIYRDLRFYHINCTRTNGNTLLDSTIPSNLNYIHIHKNGGTTIREAFYNLQKISTACQTNIYESEEIYFGPKRITRAELVQNVSNFITDIIKKQSHYEDHTNNVVLSFLRDPVVRFLSQVGETIRQGVKHPLGNPEPVFGCRDKTTSREVIQCVINEIKVNGTIVDTHYTPAAIELYLADSRRINHLKGVQINLYDMKYLNIFLNLLQYSSHVKMRSATSKEYNKYFDFGLEDLSDDMIRDICLIYEMDVILLNSIGISSSFCQIS